MCKLDVLKAYGIQVNFLFSFLFFRSKIFKKKSDSIVKVEEEAELFDENIATIVREAAVTAATAAAATEF